jgi:hypothetical protein
MPALFLLWGILPLLFVFVALYGWAMSWPDLPARAVALSRVSTEHAADAARRV